MSPEYSQPGVYVEEVPDPAQPIAGVSTLSAGDLVELRFIAAQTRKSRSGRRVLFSGLKRKPATAATRWLARELQLDLFRVDLAAVVNQYIGETEKNLRQLFAAAEKAGAMLFFDEADALFGKRSDVKDSHDRYANIEINYLLQRMEKYQGLCILALNGKTKLNSAVLRRFDFRYPPVRTSPRPPQSKARREDA